MNNLKKLTDKQLAATARKISDEEKRRANRKSATVAILAVLKKYRLSTGDLSELDLGGRKIRGRPAKSVKAKAKAVKAKPAKKKGKAGDKRATVAAKYKNPNGSEKWTGRGRAPKWVSDVLTKRRITIAQFKNSKRYKI